MTLQACSVLVRAQNSAAETWEESLKWSPLNRQRETRPSPMLCKMTEQNCFWKKGLSFAKLNLELLWTLGLKKKRRRHYPFQLFVERAALACIPQRLLFGTGYGLLLDGSWLTRGRKESCDGSREELPIAGVSRYVENDSVSHGCCAWVGYPKWVWLV